MYKLRIQGGHEHLYASIAGACADACAHFEMGRRCTIVSICGTMEVNAAPYPHDVNQCTISVAHEFAQQAWRSARDDVSRHFEQYTKEAAAARWYTKSLKSDVYFWIGLAALGALVLISPYLQQFFPH